MKSLVIFLALAVVAVGCGKKQSLDDEEGGAVKATVPVKIAPLRRGSMDVTVRAIGKTDALRKQKLYSPIAGRVISLKVLEGSAVKAGDVLAVIQTKESQAALAGAQALLQSAQTAEQKHDAQEALALAKSTENSVEIQATINGTVSSRAVSDGEFVAENAELFTVIDLSTITFIADVAVRDLPSLAVGEHAVVNLQSLAGKSLAAELDAINPQTDALSQTVKVRLRFSSMAPELRQLLKTDMFGEALILTSVQRGVFLVPRSAVLRNDETNTYTIVTFTSDSLSMSIPVQMKGMTDTTAAIADHELKEGMNVITEGHYALADSTRITLAQ